MCRDKQRIWSSPYGGKTGICYMEALTIMVMIGFIVEAKIPIRWGTEEKAEINISSQKMYLLIIWLYTYVKWNGGNND